MDDIVDIGTKPINNDNDMREDVCENCAFSRFKDTGPLGECRANPPTTGMILTPQQNPLTREIVPMLQPWTAFPSVERRTYCHTFESIEPETEH